MYKPQLGPRSQLALQVDLAVEPTRRTDMMLHSDGIRSLPQLHVNDKVRGVDNSDTFKGVL